MPGLDLPVPDGSGPADDEVEVNIFGPGVGECTLVHLGHDQWLMVDSCRGRGRPHPAAMEHLESIGRGPSSITLIVASHWHDDHVRGIADVYEGAPNSDFCVAAAIRPDEFMALTNQRATGSKFSSGVDELSKVARIAAGRGTAVRTVVAGTRLASSAGAAVTEVWTLSPSQVDTQLGREHLATQLPTYRPGQRRLVPLAPNDTSVVVLVESVAGPILLGGDLEHQASVRNRGWHAVMDLTAVPNGASTLFKVPHHGSINAHCPEVWEHRVASGAVAVVTPFDRGTTPIPRPTDRIRVRSLAGQGYLTSDKRVAAQRRDRATEKTIREATRTFKPQTLAMGHVQLRGRSDGSWLVAASEEVVAI